MFIMITSEKIKHILSKNPQFNPDIEGYLSELISRKEEIVFELAKDLLCSSYSTYCMKIIPDNVKEPMINNAFGLATALFEERIQRILLQAFNAGVIKDVTFSELKQTLTKWSQDNATK